MEVIIKKIGKVVSLSQSFTAYDGCTLYSVKLVSTEDAGVTRFVGFSSDDSFERLSLGAKLKVLCKSELGKDEVAVILTEYEIVLPEYEIIKTSKDNEQ